MDEIRVPRRLLPNQITFPTGEAQLIVVERPCVHVLDVEDNHFAHDRSILMPDRARVDGSTPALDERRLTGLGVIFAALRHAEANPDQKVLVAGHTDPSGSESYNQTLSDKRAENVQLFLTGDRDGWRNQSDAEAHTDDIQRVLKFQAVRAGWPCDPGTVNGSMNTATRNAIGAFQERYNEEVRRVANEGLQLPYRAEIGVDKSVGPETWGAFFDVYCHELMRLLETESFPDLQQAFARIQGFDALPAFVGCGEHIPFDSGRRAPFDPTDELERPAHNASDRRVEILFFDPEEEPDLVCHGSPTCDPSACPLYTTELYCHRELGVPRGLQLCQVVMQLGFEDPEGVVHPLPDGIEVEVRFDDGSTQTHVLTSEGRVEFVTARDKRSFDLALTTEDGNYVVLVPGADGAPATTELLDRDEAMSRVDDGGRLFLVPEAFDTHDCDWRVPPDVRFEEGRFVDIDVRSTMIGSPAAPAQVVLVPRWQHFRFDYFDRWAEQMRSVPAQRPVSDGCTPLVLEGHLAHVDYTAGPTDPPVAEAVWDVTAGDHTLHCLPWIVRRPAEASRELPDPDCLTRFVFPEATFVRTDGAPATAGAARLVETIPDGHDHHAEVSTAGAARLRYYDLPVQWWSRGYRARRSSEAASTKRAFETITDASSATNPYVVDLDDIVLTLHSTTIDMEGNVVGDVPRPGLTWTDTDPDRFTILDHRLEVYKPASEPYFTDVTQLSPAPDAAVLTDHPAYTRIITRGTDVFDVFDARVPLKDDFADHPIGARVARVHRGDHEGPFYSFDHDYDSPAQDDMQATTWDVGDIATFVARCCGQEDGIEIFRVGQHTPALFDYAPTNPARGTVITPPVPAATILAEVRRSLVDSKKRWEGTDAINPHRTTFEVGPADAPVARGFFHALLVRGHDGNAFSHYYRINIVADARAHMNRVCHWERADMQNSTTSSPPGRFTAAHEWGHGFGNPDHYIESANYASLHVDGIRDRFRSPGCPYSFDPTGMMNGNRKPRGYDFWHLMLWMAESGHTFEGQTELAIVQGDFRYTTQVTARDASRARKPVIAKVDQTVGAAGLCDIFAYCGGVDGFNGGDGLHGATLAEPWDMIVIVRVKLAVTLQEDDHKPYNGGRLFLNELQRTAHQVFNRNRRLVARGTFEGRSIRARVLFSPRFIVRTFPTGTSDDRTKYLDQLQGLTDKTAAAYTTLVGDLVTANGIHCDITAVEDPDTHGITNASATPRTANLDTDDVEDELVEIFGKLVGLTDPDEDDEPEQYGPLVDLLAPAFSRTSLEFVD